MDAPSKTYTAIIEQDEDGLYIARVPALLGCHTQGRTVAEATERIAEAIASCSHD